MPWPWASGCSRKTASDVAGDAGSFVADLDDLVALVARDVERDRPASVALRVREHDVENLADGADRGDDRRGRCRVHDQPASVAVERVGGVGGVRPHERGEIELGDDARPSGARRASSSSTVVVRRSVCSRAAVASLRTTGSGYAASSSRRSSRPVSADRS